MNKFLFLCFVVFCFIDMAVADVIINEVMYNPGQCDDYDCEWIELYNSGDEAVNLTGWTLNNEQLNGILIQGNEYIILADELIDGDDKDNESFEMCWGNNDNIWNFSDGNFSAYDVSLSLKNSADSIIITNGEYVDRLDYSSNWGGDGNNYSLEKISFSEDNIWNNWGASFIDGGTPGMQNSIYGTDEVDYSVIRISEFLPDPHGDDNAPMPQGEWIELYNSGDSNINLQNSFLEDLQGHRIYITDTTVTGTTTIEPNGFLIVYTNGFSGFLNNEDVEELKFYDKDSCLVDEISYEGSDEGSSWAKVNEIWQRTMPTPEEENKDYSEVKESKFKIEKVYDLGSDDKAKFGQTIRVKASLYKGDETKSVLSFWIADGDEKISKESKITISTKYTNLSAAVPVQIYPNCNEKYDFGDYEIFVGWTSEDTAEDSFSLEIEEITDSLCEEIEVEKISSFSKKFEYEIVSKPDEVKNMEEFDVKVSLENNDDEDYDIEIWSYVYRGPKCYSGEREENKKEIILDKKSSETIELSSKITEAEQGDYNLKVKIRKNNQKTLKEITEKIRVVEEVFEVESTFLEGEANFEKKSNLVKWREAFVYESTSFKANKLVPKFFISALGLALIILLSTKTF
ncbi:hypothetical protein GF361_01655 [Candidatus Woesearchaeota archaeon]|nr:hypothetical protein [Candidatus Woesearchaeota archaeon]